MPEEARERVRASNYSKEAIERELNILWKIQEERHKEAQNAIKAEISKTKATIKATEARIEAYGKEIDALIARNKMLAESSKLSKKFGFDGITDEYGENYEEKNNEYIEYWKKLQKEAQEERAKLQQKSNSLEQELKDVESSYNANRANIPGANGGTTNDSDNNYNNGNKGNNGNTSTYNTADDRQRAIRLAYQTRHNELWYEGNIGAKAYANSLKEVTNLEDLYGSTITSIDAKENIYKKYSKDLEAYQSELETFKKDIVTDLDKRIAGNQKLASILKYKNDLTFEEKLHILEVNSARIEEYKTISYVYNELNKVVQKQEDVKNKQSDINLAIEKTNQLRFKQKIQDIENETKMQLAILKRPDNYRYESQKLDIELAEARRLLEEHNAEINRLEIDKNNAKQDNEQIYISELQNSLNEELRIREELNAKIAELEYQKNYSIRSGWVDITQQFIIQGNSLKEIWSNLWRDLAREAIQRLFQVQVQSSFLGSLFGLFGSKPQLTPAQSMQAQGFDPTFGITLSHTGSSINGYPKMHTGGAVAKGRVGVMPKLKSDEVVRTLQVGEEVNSVKERRSNEILASVAMKAIDAKYQQPTNVNITALDSRSFAEYMNDNADILLAVLNKQGALGR